MLFVIFIGFMQKSLYNKLPDSDARLHIVYFSQ